MKILFFSMHAYLSVHSVPEAIVIESLRERGHDVITVNCDGVLSSYCISMSAARVSPQASVAEKDMVCKLCKKRRDIIQMEFKFPSIMLDRFIERGDEQAIQDILLNVNPATYAELVWMNIPIGKYALYEFLISNKLISLNLNQAEWEEYKIYLHNALKVGYAGRKILEKIKPDVIATYNSLYSVNHIFCALAEERGIPHYTLHAGSHIKRRVSTITIFKGLLASRLITRNRLWTELSGMPISQSQVHVVAEHIEELLKATDAFVYSIASRKIASESLRKYFGIGDGKKVLLATMSSADEQFALTTIDAMPPYIEPMFPTQMDWVNGLIKFVRQRDDLFLIIRVHPREFPNKREKVLSKNATELQKLFVSLPKNVHVNWPKDQISLHDLIKITDVGLNATSTSGLELGMFGVPVVLYDRYQLFAYPPEINYVAVDPGDYYRKIDTALRDGWSFENVRKTFRWLSYTFEHVSIDISDGFWEPKKLPFYIKLYNRFLRKLNKDYDFDANSLIKQLKKRVIPVKNSEKLSVAIERNLESHLELDNPVREKDFSYEAETVAVRDQVRRLFQMTGWNKDPSDKLAHKINRVLSC